MIHSKAFHSTQPQARRTISLCGLLFALACPPGALGATIVLTPTRDTTLYQSEASELGNGAGSYFFAGLTNRGSIRRGLLAFDLDGRIPTGAVIESVTLTLTVSKTISGPQSVSLHRVLSPWGEGAANAGGSEGTGTTAAAGDATWRHAEWPGRLWTSSGGDFLESASALLRVEANGAYVWESTESLRGDVQHWLDHPDQNFGWALRGDEQVLGSAKRFNAREHANVDSRPKLTIQYRAPVPEPTAWTIGLGVGLALVRRRSCDGDRVCVPAKLRLSEGARAGQ